MAFIYHVDSVTDGNTGDPVISVANYTREAGVRNLERNIGAVCRAIAVKVITTHCLVDTSFVTH